MNSVRFSPKELGLDAVAVPGSGGQAVGRIVPWRSKWNFQTLVVHGWLSSGVPNWNIRGSWIDWDGATVRATNAQLASPSYTVSAWSYWLSTSTAASLTGTPIHNDAGIFYGAPFMRFNVINNDPSQIVVSVEAMLYDGVGQDLLG